MREDIYILTLCLFLGAVVLIFAIRAAASIMASRAKLAGETAFREIAERAAAAETQAAAALAAIQASVSDITGRLAAVEKILKAVE